MEEEYIGVIDDPRTKEEKLLDYKHSGLATAGLPVSWEEKTNFKSFLIKNQDGSSSCVAQATSKLLGIQEFVEVGEYANLSPKFIYTRRQNYPSGGMWFHNALEIAVKSGSCKETTLPSDMRNEAYMNDKSQETTLCEVEAYDFRAKNYVNLFKGYDSNTGMVITDIDEIANVLSQGYAVLLGFKFDYDEWTTMPELHANSKLKVHHGVCAIDFGVYNNKRVISIDDSWGVKTGKGGQRFITEEFLKARCTYAGYALSLIKEPTDEVFHYKWLRDMRFYSIYNVREDVSALQKALQIRGYFPLNAKIDGIFGPITLKAVKDFQKSFALVVDGKVGPKTLSVLNKQFK